MRWLAPMAVLALICCPPARGAEDDLFSQIAVESVFATRTTTAETPPAARGRVTSAAQLAELLRRGGLEPERTDGKTVLVNVLRGSWKLPTVVRARVDRDRVEIAMGLITRKEAGGWKAEKLIDLLAAEPDASGAYFALDRERGQLQLRRSLGSRALESDRLVQALEEMAELALAREASWSQPEPSQPKPSQAATTSQAASLDGDWVASLGSNEAFALRLAGGRFSLAHVRNGQTATSTGTAKRTDAELRLAGGNGITLRGALSGVDPQGFQLAFSGGKTLQFKRVGR